MSVIGGSIDFRSVFMKDFVPKTLEGPLRVANPVDENCMIRRAVVDNLAIDEGINPKNPREHFCKEIKNYYNDSIQKLKEKEVAVGNMYFKKPLEMQPIHYRKEDKVKTEYQMGYCKRGFIYGREVIDVKDFNVKLADDTELPQTSTSYVYRNPASIALKGVKRTKSMRPVPDNDLKNKTAEILNTSAGMSTYQVAHGILGQAILEATPYGKPYKSPECCRWGFPLPGGYIYRIR